MMFSSLEVFVHAGPLSLVAMSGLDWERSLLQEEAPPALTRCLLSIPLGPVSLRIDVPVSDSRKLPAGATTQ